MAVEKLLQIFKCDKCGNMVEVIHVGGGTMTCCGQDMTLVAENSTDAAKEKHVPVITRTGSGYKVAVGSVAHPMEAEHYIVWIELLADGKAYRQFLAPGQAPEATFCVADAVNVSAREWCNKHGVWKADL